MVLVTETNLRVSAPDPSDAPNIHAHLHLPPPLAEGSSDTGEKAEPKETSTGM